MIHEGSVSNPIVVVQRAKKKTLLQGYKEAFLVDCVHDVTPQAVLPQGAATRVWTPPPMSCYKVNWEAYLNSITRL